MGATDRDDEVLRVELDDGYAVVTLDRPQARNALDAALRRTLHDAMRALDGDDAVAAIVLTGADPAFCAGLDLKELARQPGSLSGGGDDEVGLGRPFPAMSKPVIGAINGVAITGGFELALACDFLIASEHGRFADTHARVGIMPGWGLTVLLPQAVGIRRARELSATGNFLDAATAYDWGLVNHVVPHEELLPAARRLAADIAGNDRSGVRQILATYQAGSLVDGAEAFAIEQRHSRAWLANRSASGAGADLEARRRAVTERGRTQL